MSGREKADTSKIIIKENFRNELNDEIRKNENIS